MRQRPLMLIGLSGAIAFIAIVSFFPKPKYKTQADLQHLLRNHELANKHVTEVTYFSANWYSNDYPQLLASGPDCDIKLRRCDFKTVDWTLRQCAEYGITFKSQMLFESYDNLKPPGVFTVYLVKNGRTTKDYFGVFPKIYLD